MAFLAVGLSLISYNLGTGLGFLLHSGSEKRDVAISAGVGMPMLFHFNNSDLRYRVRFRIHERRPFGRGASTFTC